MKVSVKDRLLNTFFGRTIFLNLLFVLEGAASFAVDLVIAAGLGLGSQSDGLYAAWTIPQAIGRGMFQSLTNSFMGLFADENSPDHAYNQAITVILVTAFSLALLFSLLSFVWLPLTIPGAEAETIQLALPLAAILSWLVGFLALSETFRAIYYRENKEVLPSVARLIGAFSTIIFVLIAAANESLVWVAWGIFFGAGLEAAISFLGLRWQLNIRYRFSWPHRERLGEIGGVIGPPLVGQAVRILAGMAQIALASFLAPGSVTAISFSNRIINNVERFVYRGFVIATIQSYSSRIRKDFTSRFRLALLVSIPIIVILAVLPEPLVATVFGRGRFTAEDVQVLAIVLQTYAASILTIALTRIPLGLAYAQKQSRMIFGYFLIVSFGLILAEIILLYLGTNLRAFGIANAISMGAAFVWLYIALMRPLGIIMMTRKDVFQISAVGLTTTMGTAVIAAQFSSWPSWVTLGLGTAACLLLLPLTSKVFKLKEYTEAVHALKAYRG